MSLRKVDGRDRRRADDVSFGVEDLV